MQQSFLEHDTCEKERRVKDPFSHNWDDADEPVSRCLYGLILIFLKQVPGAIDRHVTDNVKHEVKHFYGADMAEVMGLNASHRSVSIKSSARRSTKSNSGAKKGLLRKMSMKMSALSNTVSAIGDSLSLNATVIVGEKKKKRKKSSMKRTTSMVSASHDGDDDLIQTRKSKNNIKEQKVPTP